MCPGFIMGHMAIALWRPTHVSFSYRGIKLWSPAWQAGILNTMITRKKQRRKTSFPKVVPCPGLHNGLCGNWSVSTNPCFLHLRVLNPACDPCQALGSRMVMTYRTHASSKVRPLILSAGDKTHLRHCSFSFTYAPFYSTVVKTIGSTWWTQL